MGHQSNYRKEKEAQQIAAAQQQSKRTVAVVLGLFAAATLCVVGIFSIKTKQDEQIRSDMLGTYGRIAPDYASMTASPTAQDTTTATEGAVDLETYAQLSVVNITNDIDEVHELIGDDMYVSLIQAMTTDYFKDSMEYDYEDFNNQVDEMLQEAELIDQLYGRYEVTYPGEMVLFNGCATGEECDMKTFIDRYTSGELKQYLTEAHQKWESLIYFERERQSVDESYLKLYYQDEVVNNLDYLDKYDVSFVVLNSDQIQIDADELQEAYENGWIPETRVCNYGDIQSSGNITVTPNKNALAVVPLYKDLNYYESEEYQTLAADTITRLFASSVMNNSTYLGSSELEDNDALVSAIQNITSNGGELGESTLLTDGDGNIIYQGEGDASISLVEGEEGTDESNEDSTSESIGDTEETELTESVETETGVIEEVDDYATQEDLLQADMSQLLNWHVVQMSLTNRNEKDVIYILWKLNRCEHTDKIPILSEMQDSLELKAQNYFAQQKIGAVIYAELNDMTDEEVEEYVDELFGHNHTHSSSSTGSEEVEQVETDEGITDGTETEQVEIESPEETEAIETEAGTVEEETE